MTDQASRTKQLANSLLTKFKARDRDGAAADMAALLDADSSLGPAWRNVVKLAMPLGETSLALVAAERIYRDNPGDAGLAVEYAGTLAQMGQHERAQAVLNKLGDDAKNTAPVQNLLGVIAAERGEFDAARRHLEATLESRPGARSAWFALASLGPVSEALRERLEREVQKPMAEDEPAASLYYALGKARDDAGDYEGAFNAYRKAGGILQIYRAHDRRVDAAGADVLMRDTTAELMDDLALSASTADPIFILGLPRSGTTLLTQMLSRHPRLGALGEVNFAQAALMPVKGFDAQAMTAFDTDQGSEGWTRVGDTYRRLAADRLGAPLRSVDKSLSLSRLLGPLAQALPRARFIHIQRDAGDNAMSCFRTYFAQGLPWTAALGDIGHHFRTEEKLMAHWKAVLPNRILTISYEELVSAPESVLTRVADHIGEAYVPEMADPSGATATVNTASVFQSRQGLNRGSIGIHERYGAHTKAFFDAYAAER
ncbi:tetratricopeptide repeat-containing sulfotransferase family protein [Parvularcula sp. LCG005]|uniref:tetratricopeptide repeat-containing sulfotransferase family protein n=1 Tax=Parvularcula sp. LCG005 TaxID=3078805 RepID=UPI0029426CDB|nr:sulfotransferase [Parvularcula sp. LCG005]WOI54387.1 sulfotransferase [Parvularcula sp. LCG005]